jgi:hypothetical protein
VTFLSLVSATKYENTSTTLPRQQRTHFRFAALILWNDIEPSKEWIEKQVPSTIRPYCMIKPSPNSDIDYEAMK